MMKGALLLLAVSSVKAVEKPNLVLILGDDVGYNSVGFHGNNLEVETPRLDALASDGVTFSRFYAYCWCGPSRAALLSGRYAHHVYQNNQAIVQPDQGLPLGFATLADKLRGASSPPNPLTTQTHRHHTHFS